jgi:hypothetical protein
MHGVHGFIKPGPFVHGSMAQIELGELVHKLLIRAVDRMMDGMRWFAMAGGDTGHCSWCRHRGSLELGGKWPWCTDFDEKYLKT